MANHKSAKKRVVRNKKRSLINGARISRMRTRIKDVLLAVEGGDSEQAKKALQIAQPEIMRAVAKGLLHKNTAARKMSRLSNKVKGLK